MIATFAPAAATMEAEFDEDAGVAPDARLALRIVPTAMDALRRSGDAENHNALVSTEAHRFEDIDALMLAISRRTGT